MKPVLHTQRLILRTLDESASEMAAAFNRRNLDFFKEWEPARQPDYYTAEAHAKLLAEDMRLLEEGLAYKFWLCKAGEESRVIGFAAISNVVRGAFQSCHLGYKLDREEQGRGYMTEAVRAVVDYAFEELRLHRVEANIIPRNKASLGVVRRLGFYEEGLAQKYLRINGSWEDHVHMVLRNTDME